MGSDDASDEVFDSVDKFHEARGKSLLKIANSDSDESSTDSERELSDVDALSSEEVANTVEIVENRHGKAKITSWGTNENNYFGGDVNEDVYANFDKDTAMDEEEAALEMQNHRLIEADGGDFMDPEMSSKTKATKQRDTSSKRKRTIETNIIDKNLNNLTPAQKRELVERESPELPLLLQRLHEQLSQIKKLQEVVRMTEQTSTIDYVEHTETLGIYRATLSAYSCCLSFYLLLRASGNLERDHPVYSRLVEFHGAIEQQKDRAKKATDFLKSRPPKNSVPVLLTEASSPSLPRVPVEEETRRAKRETALDYYNQVAMAEEKEARDREEQRSRKKKLGQDFNVQLRESYLDLAKDGKRKASQKILNNRGLVRYRNKLTKNPRVKFRRKYEKKLKIRAHRIKEFKETKDANYVGEGSGIKDNVTKSIPLPK